MNTKRRLVFQMAGVLGMLTLLTGPSAALAQDHSMHGGGAASSAARDLGTGAAFDNNGRLWVVTKETENADQYVTLRSSTDMGKTWTAAARVQKTPEPVAASGEARPHIALGPKGEIYISYTSTIARPHIGNIRFVRSLDGGKTFSAPITVHANREHVVHSFESMAVAPDGRIYIAWIDGRDAAQAKQRNARYAGSAVYYAVSSDQGESFAGDYKVADHSCECCRIGLALNRDGTPVAMWRHVFAPNIRDHAIAELGPKGALSEPVRATFDDWRIDACPHHGPSIAFGNDGTRHQVWFNGKEGDESGALYAAERAGKLSAPTPLGGAPSSHPDVLARDKQVAIVWKEFDGQATAVVVKLSEDGGNMWIQKEVGLTSANSDSPYLIKSPDGIVLIWRTQDEGIRVIPVQKGKV
ncbi:exo-alpha-sialidase [Herbaspirillum sp. HC18]|nr:exo-alpha-sialidase [Herbaspirillum sp. HC18]